MKLKKLCATLAVAGLMSAVGSAQAAIAVNNWQIDLGGIGDQSGAGGDDFTGFGVYGPKAPGVGINQLSFDALFHAVIVGPVAAGSLQHVDVAGNVTAGTGSNGAVIKTTTDKFLNDSFEFTFLSTTTSMILGVDVFGIAASTHLAAGTGPDGLVTNGVLQIYADVIGADAGNLDGGVTANTDHISGGTGMDDGFLLAEFLVQDAGGLPTGSFNTAAFDGQDDATFLMTFNSGYVTDEFGVALAAGTTLAFTDSNTDADPDANGVRDTDPAGWGAQGLGSCGFTAADVCGNENGSFSLAQLPEPGSLALVGVALAGLAAVGRRRSV